MLRIPRTLIVVTFAVLVGSGCLTEPIVTPEEYLDFQDVGRIELGHAERDRSVVRIPLVLDKAIWKPDSARIVARVQSYAAGRRIFVTLITVESSGWLGSNQPKIMQAGLGQGLHEVVYIDADGTTHPIGKVEIPRLPKLPGPEGA